MIGGVCHVRAHMLLDGQDVPRTSCILQAQVVDIQDGDGLLTARKYTFCSKSLL
jgi:hypothetical protein